MGVKHRMETIVLNGVLFVIGFVSMFHGVKKWRDKETYDESETLFEQPKPNLPQEKVSDDIACRLFADPCADTVVHYRDNPITYEREIIVKHNDKTYRVAQGDLIDVSRYHEVVRRILNNVGEIEDEIKDLRP